MDPTPLSSECLEQQRGLWLRLAEFLEQAQDALLQGKVELFELCTEEQQQCCDQLRALGPVKVSSSSDASAALTAEIKQVQLRVRHLNRVHAALLRRASRSLLILRNLLNGSQTPYTVAMRLPSSLDKG